VLFYLFLWK